MRNRILIGLAVVVATAAITYGIASWTSRRPHRTGPSAGVEEPAPDVKLDPNDPTANWPTRYRGKPMLLVIEAYVLDTIGELPPRMQQLVPELVQRAFGKSGDWKATLREQLGWRPDIDQTIRDNWTRYQRAAEDAGFVGNSLDFAQQFADAMTQAMEEKDGGR